ncbi:uncharacterized protein N7529_003553 [Penicillium soppii]|jgi:hypothetical protein|uniref:uncharacterized protein n=1 Tax=Penicillium soppii TaxID=69789 RepID=UPI00254996F2|nr:uncharacterized protein N7529_003553 [Penicillium soppii]KAJ5871200.1 hypothetical protein N7529_003553 [Penicillium soppii]
MTDPSSAKSNEALALLWAYELNRENKHLFKGLKKANRCLAGCDKSHPSSKNVDHELGLGDTRKKKPKKT